MQMVMKLKSKSLPIGQMFGCRKWAILPIHQIPLGYYPFKGNLGVHGPKRI